MVVMGIVNTTPDSFADGGQFPDADSATGHALRLADEGAEIIDIGGESSRPGAEPVGDQEELRRVLPVLHALLRGELPFRYRRDSLRRERQSKTARSTSVPTETMSGPELKLFKALKQLRSEIAREGNVPAYVVFTDRSLADMAAKRPTCKESFSAVHGVGEAKLEKFAAPFIDLILKQDKS